MGDLAAVRVVTTGTEVGQAVERFAGFGFFSADGMTARLREAMDDVRRSVAVLAARVRDAHVARSPAAIHGAVAAGTGPSRTRDTDPAAAAALNYGLSKRAP
ncbi:hypothetical protein [Kitasatospora sp. NPDC093102]|uniref:hypothetical protein n=1 Tax=Kitasatospora sp. NPDC093102 TaxID=3155069 RepID=UPI00342F6E03